MIRRCAVVAVAVLALTVVAPGASADPLKAGLALEATCDDGQTVQVVVDGEAAFTPAHVVITCGIDDTRSLPLGTPHLFGTVIGFFTPAS